MQTEKSLLITRPRHEHLTDLLYHWSQIIVDEAQSRGFQVLDLSGEKANRSNFKSYTKKNNPNLVVFNGHGSQTVITGHENEVLIGVNDGEDLLQGKVIYARSCDAAKKLAPEIVNKGAKAFLGYKRKFTVASSRIGITRPLQDRLARLFLEPSNLAPLTLIKGNTILEADRRSKMAMRKNFLYMLSSAASPDEQAVASYLWGNIKAQVIVGDENATI